METIPLFIVKNWKYFAVAAASFALAWNLKSGPAKKEVADTSKSTDVSATADKADLSGKAKVNIKKKDGTEIVADIDLSAFFTNLKLLSAIKSMTHSESSSPEARPWLYAGVAASKKIEGDLVYSDLELGVSAAFVTNKFIVTGSVFPKDQRGETSLLIPLW